MQISENHKMSPFFACVLQQSAATLAGNRGLSKTALSLPSCTLLMGYVLDDIATDGMDMFFSWYWILYCSVCSRSV